MFGNIRHKSNLLPVAVVMGAVAGAFLVESGITIASPSFAASILSPASTSDDATSAPDAFADLLKFDDKLYRVSADASVDMDAYSSTTVKKISGGKVNAVNIATTSTGTYSTDGLASEHVLYPGITVERVHPVLVATDFSFIYMPLKETNRLKNYFSNFDLFISDDETTGCLQESSYTVCK